MLPTHRPPTSPGKMLLESFMKPLGLSQTTLAGELEVSVQLLNELINGKRGLSADTAVRLAKRFKMTPQFWFGLQMNFELWHAKQRFEAGVPSKHSSPVRARAARPPEKTSRRTAATKGTLRTANKASSRRPGRHGVTP